MISTLREFVIAVNAVAGISDAYYIFEDNCTDELRSLIYSLADSNTLEPFRNAMRKMGYTDY